LRDRWLSRTTEPAFQSVILAGVHDIRSLKLRIRPRQRASATARMHGLWNIAAYFIVDMSLSQRKSRQCSRSMRMIM
jgi:hypothetical protein